jgi:2-oxo-4-hydroxy-4-carboxy--5-ureidoimidazoline (OHCU) decarboxylase
VSSPPLPRLVDAATLGDLDRHDLATALAPLWEDAGPLVDALLGRSVRSWEDHLDQAGAAIAAMDGPTRVALLRAHPRIGADPAALAALNDEYETRFGFPFVEWVAGRPQEAIVAVLAERLGRTRDEELEAGVAALAAIARDRLTTLRSAAP